VVAGAAVVAVPPAVVGVEPPSSSPHADATSSKQLSAAVAFTSITTGRVGLAGH